MDCCVFIHSFPFKVHSHRNDFWWEFTTVENLILDVFFLFGVKYSLSYFASYFIKKPSLDVTLICRSYPLNFDWTAFNLRSKKIKGTNICSQVLLIKENSEERKKGSENCGKFGICFIVWLRGSKKNGGPPPAHKLPNDFQLFNFYFFLSNHAILVVFVVSSLCGSFVRAFRRNYAPRETE